MTRTMRLGERRWILWGRGWREGGGVNESFDSARFEDFAQDEDDDRNTDAAVVPALPPLPCPVGEEVQDTGENKEVTTAPSAQASTRVDVRSALKRAESSLKAQKTKNASIKNKEGTLIAGTIAKLLEKDNSSSDGISANMSMMLMRLMEAINKSTEKRERRERIDKRRKRKRCKKRRAKKRERNRERRRPSKGRRVMVARSGVSAAVTAVPALTAVTARATATVTALEVW